MKVKNSYIIKADGNVVAVLTNEADYKKKLFKMLHEGVKNIKVVIKNLF